jgi:hypothetical protein
MRMFIRYQKDGQIVSVAKANVLPDGLEHPYGDLAEDEAVLGLDPDAGVEHLQPHEIAERFTVDVEASSLRTRGDTDQPARSPKRPRKRQATADSAPSDSQSPPS